jgi:hypothetical protein
MTNPDVNQYWKYHIEEDPNSPLMYKVVRGETIFAKCRDRKVANIILSYYINNESKEVDGNTKLPYE